MYEMKGNQYFLARNYKKAAENLEMALQIDPANKGIKRKLIICYVQTGLIDKAVELFISLSKEDISFIINTDPIEDDCPCPELVYDIEARQKAERLSLQQAQVLGILWLYCDVEVSHSYFQKALEIDPSNSRIKTILAIMNAYRKKSDLINYN